MSITSTELALALNIDKRTPGCWGTVRNNATRSYEPVCLWPLPDSGEPGAELFMSALLKALGYPIIYTNPSPDGTKFMIRLGLRSQTDYFYEPVEALYAAWRAQEKANGNP